MDYLYSIPSEMHCNAIWPHVPSEVLEWSKMAPLTHARRVFLSEAVNALITRRNLSRQYACYSHSHVCRCASGRDGCIIDSAMDAKLPLAA